MPRPYFHNHNKIKKILMVNHAGEYGAQRIYEGQIISFKKDNKTKKIIQKMLAQEIEHLSYFESKIKNGESRPTIFIPIWHNLGYLMGRISGYLGKNTAMLVTEAVEDVIVKHYNKQIEYLEKTKCDNKLLQKIKKFRDDEASHIHIAEENNSNNVIFYNLCAGLIRKICSTAIFLSSKL